ncbi:ABC transporter ATP-binding protein [Nocardioides sediminis]|uniref:ABC transporter ATP-binding protein n=1 Tax=Nocardioides sediminis TaxID=433648 RepID=UPI001F382E1C|nr:ABC transporter ATP-binding protein [Nocardioides sediminis]
MVLAVEVEGLRKEYGRTVAVADVSFTVEPGEIFGLLGPNGSGKTTTVECVQGLRRADAGRIRVLGLDPATDATRLRRLVGSQLQDSALPDRLRVGEALELFAAISPHGPPWRHLLEEWGLADQRRTAFADLSGGQRQRLFVALALVSDPRLVVLDEMTTGLDPAARRVAWNLVEAVRDRGTTVVLVTHFMDEAHRLCDRVAVLSRGRVLATGTPAALIAAHQPETVVRFTAPPDADVSFLRGVGGVRDVARVDGTGVLVRGSGPLLARVGHALVERGLEPEDLAGSVPSLEDAYLALTGGAAEDGAA